MKKILISIFVVIALILSFSTTFAGCPVTAEGDVGELLDTCLEGSKLVIKDDLEIAQGSDISKLIQSWVNNISLYLGLFAVGSIVYGGMMMTFSGGEEEKIKKGKDVLKWGIIGFVGLISVSAIINLIVKIMYSI